jgi:hypothetical protein
MADTQNLSFGESNKLEGETNYNVWRLKVKVLFKRENMWEFTETKTIPAAFLVHIGGQQLTEYHLRQLKNKAISFLVMAVKDDLVNIIAEHDDPADAWRALQDQF